MKNTYTRPTAMVEILRIDDVITASGIGACFDFDSGIVNPTSTADMGFEEL